MTQLGYWLVRYWLPRDRREVINRVWVAGWAFYQGYKFRRNL